MKSLNNNQQAFFELLRAGLWNEEARLSKFGAINLKLPKEEVLLLVEQTLQLELTVKGFFKGIG